MKITLIITLPCVVCFTFIPSQIIKLLYADKLSGFGVEGLNIAYRLLTISGFGVVFLAINQLYSSCLQAMERRIATIRNLFLAVIVKFVIELIFLPSIMINIYALAVGNTACYAVAMILNHMEIKEIFPLKFDYLFMCKLLLANVIMLFVLISILTICQTSICILLSIAISGFIYLITLFALKIFNNKDKAMFKYVMQKG